ncbi:MAG: helix-turn-helix transcriptional regulator [Burkholderiales bacterium]|nr:helix-turn-helix transcriptional regulator [Burkholderiales bacterium]
MKISGEVRWTIEGLTMEPRLVMLLESIARTGNLQAAAKTTGLSYRHAWGLLEAAGNELGESLVVPQQGKGTQLSPLAERLLAGLVDASGPLAAAIREAEARLLAALETGQSASPAKTVVVHASHDLALARLRDVLQSDKDTALELHFQGSLDCLAALRRKQCDIAGFHLPVLPGAGTLAAQLRPWLRMKSLLITNLFDRTQGLMVSPGNPKKLVTIADLTRKGVRFVNRQPGSGTRLCFDFLLADRGLRPGAIHGYAHEEFTHAAVAATVASGMADAGFGIEAAAKEQGLAFVPLLKEHYYLAARAALLRQPRLRALLARLEQPAFRKMVSNLAGYKAGGALEWIPATELLE